MLMSSGWKPCYYLSEITLKSNRKHVTADGIVRAQKRKCLSYWGGDRKKCNGHRKFKKKKRSITLRNAWLPPAYILCFEIKVASLFNSWLVSGCKQTVFRLYFSWTRGRLSETLKALLQRFCCKKHTKNGFNATIYHVVKRSFNCLLFCM